MVHVRRFTSFEFTVYEIALTKMERNFKTVVVNNFTKNIGPKNPQLVK